MPVRLGNRAADELWWRKIRRGGRVHDDKLHPCTLCDLHLTVHLGLNTSTRLITGVVGLHGKMVETFPNFFYVIPAITGVTQHSGLIGVCLSLASLFWGSGWMGFVAVVLPEAWLG